MLKRGIFPAILFLLVIIGCVIVNVKNTEALSPLGNTESNYEIVTEEFGEDFAEFIKDKANIKIYVNNKDDTAEIKIGDKDIKLTKSNFFISKLKLIANFFIKQIKNIKNSLGKITENTLKEENVNDKINIIVDDFIEWLEGEN